MYTDAMHAYEVLVQVILVLFMFSWIDSIQSEFVLVVQALFQLLCRTSPLLCWDILFFKPSDCARR